LWVVYLRNSFEFSIGRLDFGDGLVGAKWTFWHPQANGMYDVCLQSLACTAGGLGIAGSQVLVPWVYNCSLFGSNVGAALFGFDVLANKEIARWEAVYSFDGSSQAPFWSYPPCFSGIQVREEKEAWVFGSFVFAAPENNQTVFVNLARVDLVHLKLIPIETMDLPSVIPSRLYAGAFGKLNGREEMFWAGGAVFSLPNGFDVLNLAGMNLQTGTWTDSTQDDDAPPVSAEVAQIVFNRYLDTMTVVSRERRYDDSTSNGFCFARQPGRTGMNVFRRGGVFPDPVQSEWVFDVAFVTALDVTVSTEFWLPILVIGLSVLAIVGVSVLIVFVWKLGSRKSFRYIEIPNYQAHGVQTNVKAILQDQDVLKLPHGAVELGGLIGQGGQGVVRRAKFKGQDVAAKAVVDFSQEVFSSFVKEIKLLASISHPNIVKFMGIYLDNDVLYLVTELMDTDLRAILSQLDSRMKIQVAIDIASAVSFLHSFHPPVLHRDLKADNILVSRDGRVKLTDFGVSRLLVDGNTQKAQMTRDVGTLLYMVKKKRGVVYLSVVQKSVLFFVQAPELFTSHRGYDTSADVYSYALVVLEVFTGQPPFAPLTFKFMLDFVDKVIARKIEPGLRPKECRVGVRLLKFWFQL
jgi:hypothetical protein